jgi:hypothetical protein
MTVSQATARGWRVAGTEVFNATMRPFAADSPWNTATPGGTTWYDTPRLHTLPDGTTPTQWYCADSGALAIYYGSGSDPMWSFPMPDYIYAPANRNRSASTFSMRAPATLTNGSNVPGRMSGDSDNVFTLIDKTTGDYVEVWNSSVNQGTRVVETGNGDVSNAGGVGWARGNILTGPGCGTLTGANDGVRAANFAWIGGAITGRDITRIGNSQPIDHAIALAAPYHWLKGSPYTSSYRAPATSIDFGGWAGPIVMGSKIGIPAATSNPGGLSTMGNAMFNALKTYGAYVGDYTGGPWPQFYYDQLTVVNADVQDWFEWNGGLWTALAPLLRVADYQP